MKNTFVRPKLCAILFLPLLFVSCTNKLNKEDREHLKNNLLDKTINVGRGGKIFYIAYYYKTCRISFSFENDKFLKASYPSSSCEVISKGIEDSLLLESKKILRLMHKYDFSSSGSMENRNGIALTIYMNDNSVYLYCPDIKKLKGNWIQYIKSSEDLGGDWYYKEN